MPAILRTELQSPRTRALAAALYALLVLGGATMVYPFLVMLSGSTKSSVDASDYDVVPRYWHDGAMLYRKYVEEKCNEQFSTFGDNYGAAVYSFRDVQPPPPAAPGLVADWRAFTQLPAPRGFYLLGASMSRDGQNVPPNLRAFRRHLQALCGGDVRALQATYGLCAPSWMAVMAPYEPLTDRGYQPADSAFLAAFHQFKESCPPGDRVYLSLDHAYAEHVALLGKYGRDVGAYNRLNGTSIGSFSALTLDARRPAAEGPAQDWEGFVREHLNRQFIALDPGARSGFAAFLEHRHASREALNPLLYAEYLRDRELLPARWIRVDTPETRWRTFLRQRYPTPGAAGQAHGRAYDAFDTIRMPQAEADYAACQARSGALRRRFAGRNFRMVFEYILLYGRGIRNTLIFCTLAVLAALLVNPLAAYALSRYNLRGQYKILLLLIATMAFPPVVTMIPNFLLIKELGLLNTFAALILPGAASGYSIFLLKGLFDSLPRELYEAADIDGATEWHKFWIITLALSKPILAVVALGAFVAAYSDFMMAFILCQDPRMWTLMVWLFKLQGFAGQGVVFASLIVAALPTLAMFLLCQNLIIRGIVVPTEK